ncbi:MAG: GC-type dockerin domain-anchored protein, partial [Planctomycetota bacterium]
LVRTTVTPEAVATPPTGNRRAEPTIDAWVNLEQAFIDRQYTIVDKREFSAAIPGGWSGYRLFVDFDTNQGKVIPVTAGTLTLEFQDDAGSGIRTATGPLVGTGLWEHLAVIVDRHAAGGIDVRFALNGFCAPASISPGGGGGVGAHGTPGMRIGNTLDPIGFDQWFFGCIDELEIFDRALDCAEIQGIARAQIGGKCRESCNAEWDASFYGTQQAIWVPARLCNNTSTPQTYTLAVNPKACPFGTVPSPKGVTISPAGPVTVPAGSCSTVWLNIPRPPFTALGDASCYELCMTNVVTGLKRCCGGSVQWSPIIGSGRTGGVSTLSTGSVREIGFPVQNPGDATTIPYRVGAIGPDMQPDARAMSLDGAAPGTLVEGVLDLPAGAETSIDPTAQFVEDDPWQWYAVLLEMDLDGDGTFEAMESLSLMNTLEDPCPPVVFEDFEQYRPETEPCGIGGWTPWPGSTDVCGLVTTAEAASGMRSLRIDGQMGGATGLGDDMVQTFELTSGQHVLTVQTLVPAGASGRGWIAMLSEFPAPYNWALNLMFDADAGVIRDEQDAGLSTALVFGEWAELEVVIDLDADTVDATYNGVPFITGKSWTLGVPPSGPATFRALDFYADEPPSAGGRGTSGMYFDDIVLRTVCEPAADPCPADCDSSGVLDLFDFLCFQNLFASGDPRADLDGDGSLTLFDFLAFQNEFSRGCD